MKTKIPFPHVISEHGGALSVYQKESEDNVPQKESPENRTSNRVELRFYCTPLKEAYTKLRIIQCRTTN